MYYCKVDSDVIAARTLIQPLAVIEIKWTLQNNSNKPAYYPAEVMNWNYIVYEISKNYEVDLGLKYIRLDYASIWNTMHVPVTQGEGMCVLLQNISHNSH